MTADRLTDRELQSLRNMGNEAERAADEIAEYRAQCAAEAHSDAQANADWLDLPGACEAWNCIRKAARTLAPTGSIAEVLNAASGLADAVFKAQPKGTAKCNCTAYCGQYLMHGSCPAYPAAVTVVPAPAPLTSVCHMECGGCIDAGKCAFPGKPAEPVRYPHPDEDDAVTLWAEIHRLRAAVQGPDGYATWQEAATAERVRRVAAEKALAATQAPAPVQRGGVDCIGLALDLEARAKMVESQTTERAMKAAAHGLRLLASAQAPAVGAHATVKESLRVAPLTELERMNARRWKFAFIECDNWAYAVCKWDGEDWLPINTAEDVQELDAAMSAAQPPVQGSQP